MPYSIDLPPYRPYLDEPLPWWAPSALSDGTADFVRSSSTEEGNGLAIRLRVAPDAPVRSVSIRRIHDGASRREPMVQLSPGRWEGTTTVDSAAPLHWHFILQTDHGPYFYTQEGLRSIPPTEDHDFVFFPADTVPDWVAGAVFYQIFPDRFAQGDPAVGRVAGEYHFDGGTPQVLDWDREPLEFDAGRCQDFFNGDLEGIRRRLDYLQDLGVTALYLTPIFTARTTHRYDCIDYFSVDPALGGDEALEQLSREVHRRGMKLVLDVSINHTGSDHPWFRRAVTDPESTEATFYYHNDDGSVATWLGVPTLPQLNYGSRELRRRIWEDGDALVRHWLSDPWRIDGWRFDVANQTARRGEDQLGHDVWRNVRRAVKERNPEAWIVGEHWEDDISYLQGDQWDGAMNYFGCGNPLRRWAGELTRFEHDGPHYPPTAAASVGGRRFGGRELARMLLQHAARVPTPLQHAQLNVLDTHDIHRLHHHTAVFEWEIYRGVVMLQFLLPGAPNIWYGDEVGLAGHAESVEGCRYPMKWDDKAWNAEFRHLYRSLGRLKSNDPVLRCGSFQIVAADDNHLVAARIGEQSGYSWLLVLNKAEDDGTITIPTARLGRLQAVEEPDADGHRDSDREAPGVTIDNNDRAAGTLSVSMSRRTSRLLRLTTA